MISKFPTSKPRVYSVPLPGRKALGEATTFPKPQLALLKHLLCAGDSPLAAEDGVGSTSPSRPLAARRGVCIPCCSKGACGIEESLGISGIPTLPTQVPSLLIWVVRFLEKSKLTWN